MGRRAQSVAPSVRCVSRRPVGVIHTQRRDVPRSLLEYLRDRGIVEIKTVFNRIASAVKRPVKSDPAIRMASDLLAPAVCLVDNGAELFDRESRLRHEFAVLADPGAVSHVNLDPV